jgi:hypothetical protein
MPLITRTLVSNHAPTRAAMMAPTMPSGDEADDSRHDQVDDQVETKRPNLVAQFQGDTIGQNQIEDEHGVFFLRGLREEAVLGGQCQVDWASRNAPAGAGMRRAEARQEEARQEEARKNEQVKRGKEGRAWLPPTRSPPES